MTNQEFLLYVNQEFSQRDIPVFFIGWDPENSKQFCQAIKGHPDQLVEMILKVIKANDGVKGVLVKALALQLMAELRDEHSTNGADNA